MKKILLMALGILFTSVTFSQTNTFPTTGNVGIGTLTPDFPLTIKAGGNYFKFWDTNGNPRYSFTKIGQGFYYDVLSAPVGAESSPLHSFRTYNSSNTSLIDRLTITKNGNVGIGTISPFGNLEVSDSGDAQFQITSNGNFGNAELSFLNSFDNYGFKQFLWNGGEQLHFNFGPEFNGGVNATTNIMTLHGNGRIGIGTGTTSPGTKLEVFEPIGGTSNFITVGASSYESMRIGVDDAGARIQSHSATQPIYFMTNGVERMQVAGNGNVGIGTTSPSYKLHVNGNTFTHGLNSSTAIHIYSPQAGNTSKRVTINTLVGNNAYIYNYDEVAQTFHSINFGGSHSLNSGITVHGNGNVSIGAANMGEKLEVNGTIRSKKVKVDANGWPDYVFANDYKLRSLVELEAFIKDNHHLPEVPSAKEVEKEGLDLGDMDATLLKKVEELTLYVLELEAGRKKLERQIQTSEDGRLKLEEENNNLNKRLSRIEEFIKTLKK